MAPGARGRAVDPMRHLGFFSLASRPAIRPVLLRRVCHAAGAARQSRQGAEGPAGSQSLNALTVLNLVARRR
jgi:hypothetical protein